MRILSLFLLTTLVYSRALLAAPEIINLPVSQFEIKAVNVLEKLEHIAADQESILNRFKPAGLKVIKKTVMNNKIEMDVSKTVMLISKQIHLAATLDVNPFTTKTAGEICYNINLDLAGSDGLVTANVDSLNLVMCVYQTNPNAVKAKVWPKIVKGNHFHSVFGPIAADIIGEQMQPIIQSIKDGVQSLK